MGRVNIPKIPTRDKFINSCIAQIKFLDTQTTVETPPQNLEPRKRATKTLRRYDDFATRLLRHDVDARSRELGRLRLDQLTPYVTCPNY